MTDMRRGDFHQPQFAAANRAVNLRTFSGLQRATFVTNVEPTESSYSCHSGHALMGREGLVRAWHRWPRLCCARSDGTDAEVSFISCNSAESLATEVCPSAADLTCLQLSAVVHAAA